MADGPSVYTDKGIIYVRASAFGMCDRKLWAVHDGVQPVDHKDVTKRAFKEGHLHEKAVTEQLNGEGYLITDDQAVVELKILPNRLHIIGHIDGMIKLGDSTAFDESEYGDEARLWECKSMSRAAFGDWVSGQFGYRPAYAWQLAIYMLGMGVDKAHYSVKRRDDGFIQDWLINELPKSENEIRSRALKLYKMFRSGEMPACEASSGEQWFCEFWFLHDEDEDVPLKNPEIVVDDIPELNDLLAAYYEANETGKWVTEEKKRIKSELLKKFRNGRDVFGSADYKVEISSASRKSFDKTALTVDKGQEFIDKYTKETPYERWEINPREG